MLIIWLRYISFGHRCSRQVSRLPSDCHRDWRRFRRCPYPKESFVAWSRPFYWWGGHLLRRWRPELFQACRAATSWVMPSCQPIMGLMPFFFQGAYHSIKLPIIVLACKADLNLQIEPGFVSSLLNQYRAGLVEVSAVSDTGRAKLRRSFDWVLKAVFRHRRLSFSIP